MKKTLHLIVYIFIIYQAHATSCSLSKPQNLTVITITSCNAALSWSSVVNAASYSLSYKKSTALSWKQLNVGNVISYSIPGLSPSTTYNFKVEANCSSGGNSGFGDSITKKTLACTQPTNITATNITDHEATITWQAQCNSDSYTLKYKPTSSSKWLTISVAEASFYTLTGLNAKTSYQYKVASVCDTSTSSYPNPLNLTTLDSNTSPVRKPNIIVFVLDDARYDQFIPNGGPSWFQTPSINNIASQGANFQLCIQAESQCAPSRVSIYTGLYPHHHGCINNLTHYNSSEPLVQQILKDYGYYTGFVGKYGQNQGNPMGFDYWAVSTDDDYINPPYIVNNVDTNIAGHITNVYYQLAKTFLNKVPSGKPFLLMYFTRIPHSPAIPLPEDSSKYENDTMPFPKNFYKYSENYPSFYYGTGRVWNYDSLKTVNYKLKEFQTLYGAEDNMDSLVTYLQQKGIYDSTIIFFTSDNGFLEGEHKMSDKEVALDESIKVPMFIRYPAWFNNPKVITNNIVSNIDIAPTMLEAAGITTDYNMDGLSMRKVYKGQLSRTKFYYEFGKQKPVPAIRAVRSLDYLYAFDYCNSTTEEFYNLLKDPKEDTNQINSQSYQPLITYYQTVLDSLKRVTGDSLVLKNLTCNLQNPENSKRNSEISSSVLLHLSPNPVSDENIEIAFYDPNANAENISVIDGLGRIVWNKNYSGKENYIYERLDATQLASGIYVLQVQEKNQRFSRLFAVQH